jgi:hypothetical protein
MITVVELRAFVGANESTVSDGTLDRNLETAVSLIDTWLGDRKVKVPADAYDTVLLGVAQQLYYADRRDTSTSGQYGSDGTFVTARPKDPMHYAYPVLRKYVGWF